MPATNLEISHSHDNGRRVIAVSGEIDMATVGRLREALEHAVGQSSDVWVDLSEVAFMDSTGLTALVAYHQAMHEDSGRLTVICPRGPVLRALEVSGLDGVLRVCSSRQTADGD